jgi:hypothetical protein
VPLSGVGRTVEVRSQRPIGSRAVLKTLFVGEELEAVFVFVACWRAAQRDDHDDGTEGQNETGKNQEEG